MKLGMIAGNRALPLAFARNAKKNNKDLELVALCFKGETHRTLPALVDKAYWVEVGQLQKALDIFRQEQIVQCVMVGQISPWRIFRQSRWDGCLRDLLKKADYRPHSIFSAIIAFLEDHGLCFQDSTLYLREFLAENGVMNKGECPPEPEEDIAFGLDLITRFVELDVGQTIVVKDRAVVALESLEGTDNTIRRGARIAGDGCTVLKFSKKDQDMRFDVPVVGTRTLALLRRVNARALVLEAGKVLMLEKQEFLRAASRYGIAVIGTPRLSQ